MATVQDLADRTFRILNVIGLGDSASASHVSEYIEALNNLLESWQNERLMAYAIKETSHTLTANDGTYTIGAGGDINVTRPTKIESAFIRSNDVDYPVEVLEYEDWNRIADKTITGDIPEKLYFDPTMATGTIYLWPVPSAANAIHLFYFLPVTTYSASSDTVTLPPGWIQAIVFNLAVLMSSEHGARLSQTIYEEARRSLASIKRINRPSMRVYTEIGQVFSSYKTDIYNGE